MQEPVLHGPHPARGSVATIERSREQHVLSAQQDRRTIDVECPSIRFDSSHQYMDRDGHSRSGARNPRLDYPLSLLDENAHG